MAGDSADHAFTGDGANIRRILEREPSVRGAIEYGLG